MKREYSKPEAIIVDIELYNSVLDEPDNTPASEPVASNVDVWDDYDDIPGSNKSVWDDGSEEADK